MSENNEHIMTYEDDTLIFADEDEDEQPSPQKTDPWKVMIVDDEIAIHKVTRMAIEDISFEGRPLRFLNAYSAKDARRLIQQHPDTALILLDVVMETDDAGLHIVHYIRKELCNRFVRIILRTGQPGQAPERKVVLEYDINDYKLKSMLTEQGLFTAVISAIRTYRDLQIIQQQHQALEQAMEHAQTANKAKLQFLSNMGHELRTPLHGILGFAELLLKTELTAKQRRYIETINLSGKGLCEIINNVLDLTELETGQLTLNEVSFSLRNTIADVMNLMQIQADWKHLHTSYHINHDVPDLLIGDDIRLKQVLINLIVNAIKHTQQGEISLRISHFDEQETHLLFAVSDTGIGIADEKHQHIFKPFVVGEDVMTKRFAGAGLGLAISKDIVEKMNGRIWVESEPQQGSIFYFSIQFKPCQYYSHVDSSTSTILRQST